MDFVALGLLNIGSRAKTKLDNLCAKKLSALQDVEFGITAIVVEHVG